MKKHIRLIYFAMASSLLVLILTFVAHLSTSQDDLPLNVLGDEFDELTPRNQVRRHISGSEPKTGEAKADAPLSQEFVSLGQGTTDSLVLSGHVLDMAGRAIKGALIRVVRTPWRRTLSLFEPKGSSRKLGDKTISSADGGFSLRLRRGECVNLEVTASGFGLADIAHCQVGPELEIRLEESASIVVTCLDYRGEPIEGVHLRHWRHGRHGRQTSTNKLDGMSNKDGKFFFVGLPSGQSIIQAEHPNYQYSGERETMIVAGEKAELDLVFSEGKRVIGKIIDSQTGAPIPLASVSARWWNEDCQVTSDANGEFSLSAPDDVSRPWMICVSAEGYGKCSHPIPASGEILFQMKRADAVMGRIIDSAGAPIARAQVQVVASQRVKGRREVDFGGESSMPDGRFVISNIRHDVPHTLIITADGFGRMLLDFDPRRSGPGMIDVGDVALPPARRIEGRVSDVSGNAIAGVKITLKGHNSDRSQLREDSAPAVNSPYGASEFRFTDINGKYRFCDLSPGAYSVVLHAGTKRNEPLAVQLAKVDCLNANFSLTDDGTLSFVCINQAGDPLGGVLIVARPSSGSGDVKPATVVTRSDGSAQMRFLPENEYTIIAQIKGDFSSPKPIKKVKPGEKVIVLKFVPAGIISGTVVSPPELKGAKYIIIARWGGGNRQTTITNEAGEFLLKTPAGTLVELTAECTHRKKYSKEFKSKPVQSLSPSPGVTIEMVEFAN